MSRNITTRHRPRAVGCALLATALVAAILAVSPTTAYGDHSGADVAHRISGFDEKKGLPSYAVPGDVSLSSGDAGQTGGDGYRYSDNERHAYADYWISNNVREGHYNILIRIPAKDGGLFDAPASHPPTAKKVHYKVWQRHEPYWEGGPWGDWYVKYDFTINQKNAYDKEWKWVRKCALPPQGCDLARTYELNGPTVIRVSFEDSSSGRITLDEIWVKHQSFTTRQVELAEAASAEFDRSDCRGWWEETIGAALAIAGALITGALTAGSGWAIAIGAAVWFAYQQTLQHAIKQLTKDFIDHHVCS